MILPEYVLTAITYLEKSGFEAVVVGGAVRDYLLNIKPNDYDISTNALPDQVKKVFERFFMLDTGLKHGTVSVFINHHQVEITTYRNEEDYEDFRHPKKVVFVNNLISDLNRRDFTINAICFNKNIIDHVGGIADLNNKIIRAIGDPQLRFQEDPLRILRAIRFSSTLGFTIEEKTKNAMIKYLPLIDKVSKERINLEFNKLLLGKDADVVLKENFIIIKQFIPELEQNNHSIDALMKVEDDLNLKLATLLLPLGVNLGSEVLKRLKYSNLTIKFVSFYIENYNLELKSDEKYLKKLFTNYTYQELKSISQLKHAYNQVLNIDNKELKNIVAMIDKINESYDCFRIKDLKIRGNDLLRIGFKEGVIIRLTLEKILDEVLSGKLSNRKEDLLLRAKRLFNEQYRK